jgi:hypothetical protein
MSLGRRSTNARSARPPLSVPAPRQARADTARVEPTEVTIAARADNATVDSWGVLHDSPQASRVADCGIKIIDSASTHEDLPGGEICVVVDSSGIVVDGQQHAPQLLEIHELIDFMLRSESAASNVSATGIVTQCWRARQKRGPPGPDRDLHHLRHITLRAALGVFRKPGW